MQPPPGRRVFWTYIYTCTFNILWTVCTTIRHLLLPSWRTLLFLPRHLKQQLCWVLCCSWPAVSSSWEPKLDDGGASVNFAGGEKYPLAVSWRGTRGILGVHLLLGPFASCTQGSSCVVPPRGISPAPWETVTSFVLCSLVTFIQLHCTSMMGRGRKSSCDLDMIMVAIGRWIAANL